MDCILSQMIKENEIDFIKVEIPKQMEGIIIILTQCREKTTAIRVRIQHKVNCFLFSLLLHTRR